MPSRSFYTEGQVLFPVKKPIRTAWVNVISPLPGQAGEMPRAQCAPVKRDDCGLQAILAQTGEQILDRIIGPGVRDEIAVRGISGRHERHATGRFARLV